MKIKIINGPNMNMLGIREPGIYGLKSYEDLVEYIEEKSGKENELCFVQSNHEGVLIDEIHRAYYDDFEGIVINPAAYTHTSLAIADALRAVKIPFVEVHISNICDRESYRSISYVKDAAVATVSGHGFKGYVEAIEILNNLD